MPEEQTPVFHLKSLHGFLPTEGQQKAGPVPSLTLYIYFGCLYNEFV